MRLPAEVRRRAVLGSHVVSGRDAAALLERTARRTLMGPRDGLGAAVVG